MENTNTSLLPLIYSRPENYIRLFRCDSTDTLPDSTVDQEELGELRNRYKGWLECRKPLLRRRNQEDLKVVIPTDMGSPYTEALEVSKDYKSPWFTIAERRGKYLSQIKLKYQSKGRISQRRGQKDLKITLTTEKYQNDLPISIRRGVLLKRIAIPTSALKEPKELVDKNLWEIPTLQVAYGSSDATLGELEVESTTSKQPKVAGWILNWFDKDRTKAEYK
ncbi:hypothetical protein BC833DRAFT_607783 [Globomyces pollinis-pini]|nr:hypothetical protein BC833DRAFT_607783 [Globomyces pollinis-pini]